MAITREALEDLVSVETTDEGQHVVTLWAVTGDPIAGVYKSWHRPEAEDFQTHLIDWVLEQVLQLT